MHFLLIYPPTDSFFIDTAHRFYGLSPPQGLLYIGKVLEAEGDTVSLLDFSAEPFEEQKILYFLQQADAVGITVLTMSLENVKNIIHLIKKRKPDIPIIVGGPHCTLFPTTALKETHADICVQGDGEKPIVEIRKALRYHQSLSGIPGVTYRENHEIKTGKQPMLFTNLDIFPYPARHLVKKYVYGRGFNPFIQRGEFTSIVTSRGCPFKCTFCSRNSIFMQRYRTRSVENIIEELKEIKKDGMIILE